MYRLAIEQFYMVWLVAGQVTGIDTATKHICENVACTFVHMLMDVSELLL